MPQRAPVGSRRSRSLRLGRSVCIRAIRAVVWGLALMHALIGAAEALDEPALVLLGSPDFYGRFGFVAASSVGIEAPDPAWGDHFQVLPLTGFDRSMTGRFRYAAPFGEV